MKIIDLQADMRNVDISFRVIKKGEIREITTRNGKKLNLSEVEVGDESGRIILTLWDKSIDQVEEGKLYIVKNGFIKVIRNELRLNIGKYGKLEEYEIAEDFVKEEDVPQEFPEPPNNYRPPRKRYSKRR
ncbi:MAG: hypothetical protein U9O98_05630 [Asgard group archaeon]|nr:hypothetical protein [Asgard group archaeon]